MQFKIHRLRVKGKLRPRWQVGQAYILAKMQICAERDAERNREFLVARLMHPESGAPLPDEVPLHDVQLVHYSAGTFTLAGVEYVLVEGVERTAFAQSWLVCLPRDEQQDRPPLIEHGPGMMAPAISQRK